MKRILVLVLAWLPVCAFAETAYVTDRFSVGIYADAAGAGPVIKQLTSGTALEVLERGIGYVLVRDSSGAEGWMEESYLSTEPPARLRLEGARRELGKTQSQIQTLTKELDQARQALTATENELAQEKDKSAAATRKWEETAAAVESAATDEGVRDVSFGFNVLWLGISFAMLFIGFAGGIIWLREQTRRKLGGRYLRI